MTLFGEVSGKWLHVAPIESTDLSNSAGARSSLQRNNKKYKHKGFYRIVRSFVRLKLLVNPALEGITIFNPTMK